MNRQEPNRPGDQSAPFQRESLPDNAPKRSFAGHTVRVYSRHDTAAQADAVLKAIDDYLQHVPIQVPALIVTERPFPGLKQDLAEVFADFDANVARVPSTDTRRAVLSNWREHFLADPLPKEMQSFLKEYWSKATEGFGSVKFPLTHPRYAEPIKHPFVAQLIAGLHRAADGERPLFHINEKPRLDAWVYSIQSQGHEQTSTISLVSGDIAVAIGSKCHQTRMRIKSNLRRDRGTADVVDEAHQTWPEMIIISVFGSNHVTTQTAAYEKLGRRTEVLQVTPPSLQSRSGCNLLDPDSALQPAAKPAMIRALVADSLALKPIRDCRAAFPWELDKSASHQIFPLLDGLTDNDLKLWRVMYAELVGSRKWGPPQATLSWLERLPYPELRKQVHAYLATEKNVRDNS